MMLIHERRNVTETIKWTDCVTKALNVKHSFKNRLPSWQTVGRCSGAAAVSSDVRPWP